MPLRVGFMEAIRGAPFPVVTGHFPAAAGGGLGKKLERNCRATGGNRHAATGWQLGPRSPGGQGGPRAGELEAAHGGRGGDAVTVVRLMWWATTTVRWKRCGS